jgi:cyclophilin family peptidyl-prolyl cis-trans isomerase
LRPKPAPLPDNQPKGHYWQRSTNGAAMAHSRIPDMGSKISQSGQMLLHNRGAGHIGMACHGADDNVAAFFLNTRKTRDMTQVNQCGGGRKALLHGGDQGLTACQKFAVLVLVKRGLRLPNRAGTMIGKSIHGNGLLKKNDHHFIKKQRPYSADSL